MSMGDVEMVKIIANVVLMVVLVASVGGCRMFGGRPDNPLSVEQTDRDREVFRPEVTRPVPSVRFKIVVVSSSPTFGKDEYGTHLVNAVESAVANNFTNLGWFDTVDRKNGVALSSDSILSSTNALQLAADTGAQFALFANSEVSYVAKQGWKRTKYPHKARGAEVVTDFRLIDLSTKEPLIVRKIRSVVADVEKGNVKIAVTRASDRNAKKMARIVAARFLPEVEVLQVRGNGRYAQVAMGKNYQATPEVRASGWWPYKYLPLWYREYVAVPAARVDFLTLEKTESGRYERTVFAHGEVFKADGKKAWVDVEDYDKANVHKGNLSVVSEELDEDGEELE